MQIVGFKPKQEEIIRRNIDMFTEMRIGNAIIKPLNKRFEKLHYKSGEVTRRLGTTESFEGKEKGVIANTYIKINKGLLKNQDKLRDVLEHESYHAQQHRNYTPEENIEYLKETKGDFRIKSFEEHSELPQERFDRWRLRI